MSCVWWRWCISIYQRLVDGSIRNHCSNKLVKWAFVHHFFVVVASFLHGNLSLDCYLSSWIISILLFKQWPFWFSKWSKWNGRQKDERKKTQTSESDIWQLKSFLSFDTCFNVSLYTHTHTQIKMNNHLSFYAVILEMVNLSTFFAAAFNHLTWVCNTTNKQKNNRKSLFVRILNGFVYDMDKTLKWH